MRRAAADAMDRLARIAQRRRAILNESKDLAKERDALIPVAAADQSIRLTDIAAVAGFTIPAGLAHIHKLSRKAGLPPRKRGRHFESEG